MLGRSPPFNLKVMAFPKATYHRTSTFGKCIVYDHNTLEFYGLFERFVISSLLCKDLPELNTLRVGDQRLFHLNGQIGLHERQL